MTSVRFVFPFAACEALSRNPSYASASVIMRARSVSPCARTRYLPRSSGATTSAVRAKKFGFGLRRISALYAAREAARNDDGPCCGERGDDDKERERARGGNEIDRSGQEKAGEDTSQRHPHLLEGRVFIDVVRAVG